MMDLTDHRGRNIEPGCVVAYNWSGDIAVGVVASVRPGKDYRNRPIIKVAPIFPRFLVGRIATIRGAKHCLVLDSEF